MPDVVTHPTLQELAAFDRGESLPDAAAAAVASHLEACPACRQALQNLPPDSFLGKVRAARPGSGSLPPDPAPSQPGMSPPAGVPPELANHAKYRIVGELGRGGMGVIYLAEHRVLEKLVAIKVISPAVLDNPRALARFHGEARAAGQLDHPNIARAHDADQAGRLHFLVMEFIEGLSLAQLLEQKGPLPIAHACQVIRQVALGLQHAFEQGMTHRDIKPQNLMLTPRGVVKILDFGLARLRREQTTGPRLTQLESFMGTPEYVAPEQATDARQADTRADIYSLGCTLYALLAGRPPFVEETAWQLVLAHLEKEPPPLQQLRPEVRPDLSAVVARMLAKDPDQRYQRPIEVAQALAPFAKAGGKPRTAGGEARPVRVSSPGTGTRAGGDTSRVPELDKGESKVHTGRVPAAAREEKAAPFADLTCSPAAPPKQKGLLAKPTSNAWWKHPAVLAGLACAALVLVGLAGIIVTIRLTPPEPETSIVLEIDQPGAEVSVDGNTITVSAPGDDQPIKIAVEPGRHQLRISKADCEVISQDVEVKWGKSKPIKVRLESKVAPKPPAPTEHTGEVGSVAFSPDGRRIVSGSWDGTAKIWDAQAGKVQRTLKGHPGWWVTGVAFSPDGRRIVSGSGDFRHRGTPGEVTVWDMQTGEVQLNIVAHTAPVSSVAFSPDGQRIVSGSWDNTVMVWDAPN
jgi:serine/threonine protein kinase